MVRFAARPTRAAAAAVAWIACAGLARADYPMPEPALDGIDITGFHLPRVTSFGDSYSRTARNVQDPVTKRWVRVLNWVEQANLDGFTGAPAAYAVSGATAANVAVGGVVNSFAQQIQRWTTNGRQLGPREATAVYFGANDVNAIAKFPTLVSLQTSKSHFSDGVKKLIAAGANSGDRRLFLFLIHDWGRNPAQAGDPGGVFRQRSQNWNGHVRWFANQRPGQNIVTVDLYTTFQKVFANPAAFGLSNVGTVDLAQSASTALYADPNHFGQKGHDIIEQVFLHYAARAYGYGAAVSAGARTAGRVAADLDQALSSGLGAPPTRGLSAFALGETPPARLPEEQPRDVDPTRAGFAQAFQPDERPDGGLGLNYALGDGQALGVVIGRYDDRVESELDRTSETTSVVSDAVGVYLDQRAGPLALRSRLTVVDHSSSKVEHDRLIDATSRTRFGGRTTEVAQRAGFPLELSGATVTPWLELAYRRQENDGFTIENPYLSDVRYSGTRADEALAGLGLAARSPAIPLGESSRVELYGGLAYTQSLVRESYRLEVSEAAGLGANQVETLERPQLRQLTLDLGGRLALGEGLAVGAGVMVAQDLDYGRDEAVTLRLDYRF